MLKALLKNRRLQKLAACAAVLSGLFAATPSADAVIAVDLRFTDGTKTKPATAGNVTINIWAQITGIFTLDGNDGLRNLRGYLATNNTINGGVYVGGGANGIQSVTAINGFDFAAPGGANSGPTTLDAAGAKNPGSPFDNLQDWAFNTINVTGSSSTLNATNAAITFASGYGPSGIPSTGQTISPRTILSPGQTAGVTYNVIPGGAEFLIGQIAFNGGGLVGSPITGAQTTVVWNKPSAGPSALWQVHNVDGVQKVGSAEYLNTASTNFVTFTAPVIPEPSTMVFGTLAVVGICVYGLRRRRMK